MKSLIEQAFLHVDIIGQHVLEGHYDLVGEEGEIILPQTWDAYIQPDMRIEMRMWPLPEKETKKPPPKNMGMSPPRPPPPNYMSRPSPAPPPATAFPGSQKDTRTSKHTNMGRPPPPPPPMPAPGTPMGGQFPSPNMFPHSSTKTSKKSRHPTGQTPRKYHSTESFLSDIDKKESQFSRFMKKLRRKKSDLSDSETSSLSD